MADGGSITFSTALDNEQLERDLKAAEREVDALKAKLEKAESGKTAIEADMERAEAAIHETEAAIADLKAQMGALPSTTSSAEEYRETRDEAERIGLEIAAANEKLEAQIAEIDKLNEKWQKLDEQSADYTRQIDQAKSKQTELGEEYARTYSKSSEATSAALAQAEARFEKFGKRVNTMMKKVFVFSAILGAIKTLKSALSDALAENERFTASCANLKAVVQGIANYVASTVAPILTGFVNMVAAMLTTLAQAIDSIFKTNITEAISRARDAAQAVKEETQAVKKEGKATDKLAKAAKEATKQLMSFDEINAMAADHSNDAADALGGEADALGGEAGANSPNWDALDVGKIDEKLAEIMIVIGAALLAVGAVLAFSGINIPLGLTLMAIGALMIYTAYKEQWDKLPQEVRNAINTALVITGIVLLVIGAVLAFSSSNIPLGIGLMLAGAALLYTAAALNWKDLPDEIKTVINVIMVALSAALLVVGAILALSSPTNVPLGVGLMAAGAIGLAATAALNWDSMSNEVKGVVLTIAAIVSAALLVIGTILALSSPTNVPLGIGLMAAGAIGLAATAAISWAQLPADIRNVISIIMATLGAALLVIGVILVFANVGAPVGLALMLAGAASLATAAALNWDAICANIDGVIAVIAAALGAALLVIGAVLTFSAAHVALGIALFAAGAASLVTVTALNWNTMPKSIQNTVSAIAAIVGAALLVLGIILAASAVNAPLGIALIAVGAASIVAAAALNWDFLKDKVRDIWYGIVSFWNQNIAPIFTLAWWKNLFKSLVNGLIWAINCGLNAVGNFINLLTSGITSVLKWLGVTNWSFTITMPQIPYLAQGAVIPPNRKFLAVLGDQTNGNNIEAPEALMRQIVREEAGGGMDAEGMQQAISGALAQVLPMLQQQGSDGDVIMVLQVGHEELARAVNKGNASMARRGLVDPVLAL